MLDKIVNINSNFQYKGGSSNSTGFDKIFNGVVTSRLNPNDSIKFSPLSQYLSRINWQLKDLSFISRTKLEINFSLDGFDFSVEVDLAHYFKDNRQSYNIFRTIETGIYSSKVLLRLSSRKGKLVLTDDLDNLELKGLFRLFEKVSGLHQNGSAETFHETERDLQEGIRTELSDEFEYINVVIYNLMNKLETLKMPESIIFKEDNTEPVIIEKITIVNDRKFSE